MPGRDFLSYLESMVTILGALLGFAYFCFYHRKTIRDFLKIKFSRKPTTELEANLTVLVPKIKAKLKTTPPNHNRVDTILICIGCLCVGHSIPPPTML